MDFFIGITIMFALVVLYNINSKFHEGQQAIISLRETSQNLIEAENKNKQLEKEKILLLKQLSELEETIKQKDDLYKSMQSSDTLAFAKIASLLADFRIIQYSISEKHLKTKKRPAHNEAKRINELKKETREIIYQSKLTQYKYEYLFTLFPDLELYVDTADEIKSLEQFEDLSDLEKSSDRTIKYLTKDEYKSLPERDRNQLALERYVERHKNNWEIGRDYELYIGYVYSLEGWDVEYFGIDKQLNDMGRDLIVKKNGETHIVQCKYWAKNKKIHEKYIAQLYGTAIQYKLANKKEKLVTPVIATNISLSETAREFANYLKIKAIENKDFQEFPRIKCNINRNKDGSKSKIYHLPMDQQYDTTKIDGKEEFFAFTVKEAMDKGFRRAYKWLGN
jgi:hypothetical protein